MHVSICICTRNRGKSIAGTLRSIRRSHHQDFDVVIVDQSTDDYTEQAVRSAMGSDPRFTYIRSCAVGVSRARNVCVDHARGPIVAFTDDDCEVPPEWVGLLVATFGQHADVGQICGAVVPGPYDPTRGFIPDHRIVSQRKIISPWQKWREGGIGANMAFRLDVLRAVGPFDEVLGPGGDFHACEDGDMTYRVLKAGYALLESPDAYVVHHGFRTWEQGRPMMRRVGLGVAAAYMKHLRLGDLAILPTLLVEWARCVSWRRLVLLQPHSGLRRFLGYAQGMAASFRYRVDARTRVYKLPEGFQSVPADATANAPGPTPATVSSASASALN